MQTCMRLFIRVFARRVLPKEDVEIVIKDEEDIECTYNEIRMHVKRIVGFNDETDEYFDTIQFKIKKGNQAGIVSYDIDKHKDKGLWDDLRELMNELIYVGSGLEKEIDKILGHKRR